MGDNSAASSGQMADEKTGDVYNWLLRPGVRLIRYLLVLLITGAAVYLSLTGWFQVCKIVHSAKDGITSTCTEPDLTSAGVLAAVVFVLLLLWPDLSEFTAFGVTLKKLVQRVDRKVTDAGATTDRIDATTLDTGSKVDDLKSAVTEQGVNVADRLTLIQSGIRTITELSEQLREATNESFLLQNQPEPRWSALEQERLIKSCRALVTDDDDWRALGEEKARIRNATDGYRLAYILGPDSDPTIALLLGVLLGLFDSFRERRRGNRGEEPAQPRETDSLLRVIEWMLLAAISGDRIDEESVVTAIATLMYLNQTYYG